MPTRQPKWSVTCELEDDGNQTYRWNNRRLETVNLQGGKRIDYEYYSDGVLKSRTFKTGPADPGVKENYNYFTGQNGKFTVTVNGNVTQTYDFANGSMIRFTIGNKHYEIEKITGADIVNPITKVYEVFSLPPGTSGPPQPRTLRQAFVYDTYGRVYVILDQNLLATAEKVIPRFLFWEQYYDVDAGIYFFFNRHWYHPELQLMLNRQPPIFLPPPPPPPDPGSISPDSPFLAEMRAYRRLQYLKQHPEEWFSLPESVSSRISGVGRIVGGVVVLIVSVPADLTVVGVVVGVPLAAWSGDQIGTGLREIWNGKHETSLGGRLIQSGLGNGTAGKVATFVYDVAPGFASAPGASANAARLAAEVEVAAQIAPKLVAAETRAITQSAAIVPEVATLQQAVAAEAKALPKVLPVVTAAQPKLLQVADAVAPMAAPIAKEGVLSMSAEDLLLQARTYHVMTDDARVAVQIKASGRLRPFYGHNGLSNTGLRYLPNPAEGKFFAASRGYKEVLPLIHSAGHAEGEAAFWMWVSGARGEEVLSATVRVTERLCLHCRHRLPTTLYQLGTRELSVGILNEGLSVSRLRIPTPASKPFNGDAKAWAEFLKEMDAVSRPR